MLVTVNVGNDARDSNPLPARASAELRICCAVPKRLSLAITREHIANLSTACPTNSNILLKSKPSKLTLSAYGKCESGSMWSSSERRFDSISALLVEYSTDEPKLLTVEKLSDSDSIEG
ncbi:unnamed protein product, partial [Anisakis simplex]|uniref:Uncharacterized protein n=1 Tax=Anisakis simplex TaxID=6269 RepID=A0A0M3JIQ5_ANISI